MNKKIFHLHIPKTAGSFVNNFLRKNYKEEFIHENPYLSTIRYNQEQVLQMLSFYKFSCYAGHVFNLSNVPLHLDNVYGFSFVRKPIEKFLSFYFFQRGRKEVRKDHPIKQLSLDEYIKHLQNEPSNTIAADGSQLDWVAGSIQKDCSLIKSKLNTGNYFIFPQDRMSESLFCLIAMNSETLRSKPNLKSINTSKRDQEISKDTIEAIENLPWIKKDRELYNLACEHLNTAIQGREDEFKDWVSSCKVPPEEKKQKSFKSKVKSKLRGMLND